MKLQVEAEKLIEEQKRKEEKLKLLKNNKRNNDQDDADSTNLLLTSIKAKMGIIDLYNKQWILMRRIIWFFLLSYYNIIYLKKEIHSWI